MKKKQTAYFLTLKNPAIACNFDQGKILNVPQMTFHGMDAARKTWCNPHKAVT